jgi:transforming growth factor-beta-induced protein
MAEPSTQSKTMKQILQRLLTFLFASVTPVLAQTSAFDDLVVAGDVYSNWIGDFTFNTPLSDGKAYINHLEHGPLYLFTEGQNVWLYDWNLAASTGLPGWIYTNRDFHPYFFVMGYPNNWLFYLQGVPGPRATPRVFADVVAGTSVTLPNREHRNIAEVAIDAGAFTSLVAALTATNLADTIATGGPFTVFAPVDAAFDAIDSSVLNALLTTDTATLASILLHHVVAGELTSSDLTLSGAGALRGQKTDYYLTTLGGSDLHVQVTPFGIVLNGSAQVTVPDVQAANGTIHVIDSVLMPPGTIVDLAVANGFATLVDLVVAAGLADTLAGTGPFTVFAPTEAAFGALDSDTVSFLLSPEGRDTLIAILTYHVVPGTVYASEVPLATPVPTVNGASVTFSASPTGGLRINDANIIATNVVASNGVIHVIDAVILPPAQLPTTFSIGFDAAAFNYTINSTVGADITMRRGTTYTFERTAFSGHPFTLSTVAPGTPWSESDRYGSTPNLTQTAETIVYTPSAATPDTLYYRCTVHASMGGKISVID